MTMLATFYGGPADGGQLMLLEPIPQFIRTPVDRGLLAQHIVNAEAVLPSWQIEDLYHLELDANGMPVTLHGPGGAKVIRYRAHVEHRKPSSA